MLQQSFSTCRTCGGKLIKKDTKRKASQLLQPYYYKAYYYCSACKKIYHSDAFKVTNKVSHPEPFDRHPEQSEGAQGKLREGSHEILRFTQNDNDAYEVEIWTDGACVFNGTHNAKAAWAFVAGEYEESGKLKGKQTNNRAEAYAIYHALVWTAKQGNKHVCIYTDSQITIHGLNKPAEKVYGILEACGLLDKFSTLKKNGGIVYALQEGDIYSSDETIMILEGKVQDIIPFETILLGVISAETTKENDKTEIDLAVVTNKM